MLIVLTENLGACIGCWTPTILFSTESASEKVWALDPTAPDLTLSFAVYLGEASRRYLTPTPTISLFVKWGYEHLFHKIIARITASAQTVPHSEPVAPRILLK